MDLQDSKNGGELPNASMAKSTDRNRMARLVAVDEARLVSWVCYSCVDVVRCDDGWGFSSLTCEGDRGGWERKGGGLEGQRAESEGEREETNLMEGVRNEKAAQWKEIEICMLSAIDMRVSVSSIY